MKILSAIALVVVSFSASVVASTQLLIFTENSPPYQYSRDGEVQGIATKRVMKIAEQAGLSAQISMYPWARALRNAEQSSQALIYSMAKTPQRNDTFIWIAPVASFELGILTLKQANTQRFALPLDPSNLSVATQRGDIAADWLAGQGFIEGNNLILCADIVCSWQQLKRGTVDFIIEDPRLIEETAGLVGLTPAEVTLQNVVPALSVTGYLAANKNMDAAVVARLKQAAQTLGYREEQ
ncbi:MAG: transporter substrate-binding domain-containing protein [Alteromonadaceae bacterium]|nr:transporter substrate-binding domain-containing protein [Alteromonadaceae bacterium]